MQIEVKLEKVQVKGKGLVRDKEGRIKGEITFEGEKEMTSTERESLQNIATPFNPPGNS